MTSCDLKDELLYRGLTDMLQLSEIIFVVSKNTGIKPHDELAIMPPTLDAVRDLLEAEYAIAGDVTKDNEDGLLMVRSWDLTPSDTIARIEREWRELKEPPNLGDVVWLELTETGRAEARKLALREELLDRGLGDILQLSEIVSVVSRHVGIGRHDEPAIIAPTLDAIRDLVEPGWAIAGNAVQDTNGYAVINSWKLTPAEAIDRIEKDWGELKGPPSLGDVVWLELTHTGRAEALRVLGDQR